MKVSEMSLKDAKVALVKSDSALQAAAAAFAKSPKDEKALKALRDAAIDFTKRERDARSASARETKVDLFT